MNKFTKCMIWVHRLLGTVLSLFFLMWFVSGLIMVYHHFPRVSDWQRIDKMAPLDTAGLPSISQLQARLPEGEHIRTLSLDRVLGQMVFHVRTEQGSHTLPALQGEALRKVNGRDDLLRIVGEWCTAPIERIDTLYRLDQWIPYERMKKELPIYKFYFNDPDRHQLYVGAKSGRVLQFSTHSKRAWAWVGPIPHWVYLTSLRQDTTKWTMVIVFLSGLGVLMGVAGLYLGIRGLFIAWRRGKLITPYKRKWYVWHHVVGLLFGLFVLMFIFSGMMSVVEPDELGVKSKLPFDARERMDALAPDPSDYALDYREAIAAQGGGVRRITWESFGPIPYYSMEEDSKTPRRYLDARRSKGHDLYLTEADVRNVLTRVHGSEQPLHIEWMKTYDIYYAARKQVLPLPVWRIKIDDADRTRYYINPETGSVRLADTPYRFRRWTYSALHSLRIPFLVKNYSVWSVVMWTLMVGGMIVSSTGVWLGCRYLAREIRRSRKAK